MNCGLLVERAKDLLDVAVIAAVILTACGGVTAAEYIGAEAVVAKIVSSDQQGKANGDNELTPAQLLKEIKQLSEMLPTMPAEEAGRKWVQLVQKLWNLEERKQRQPGTDHNFFQMMLLNLPRPDAWPALQQAARDTTSTKPIKPAVLQIMAAKLNGDDDETSAAFSRLKAIISSSDRGRYSENIVSDLEHVLLSQDESLRSVVDRFARLIELRRKSSEHESTITVPDLVALSDEPTARRLLTEAVTLKNTKLNFTGSNPTSALAKQVAFENLDKLKTPRWDLVQSLDSTELFDALIKKFPEAGKAADTEETTSAEKSFAWLAGFGVSSHEVDVRDNDREKEAFIKAKAFHYLDLVAAGKLDEASNYFSMENSFLSELDLAIGDSLARLPLAMLHKDLSEKLSEVDDAPYELWSLNMDLARQQGHLKEFIPRMASAADKVGPDDKSTMRLYRSLSNAYLELNQPEQAVEYLVKIGNLPAEPDMGSSQRADAAHTLVRLGEVLEKPEWSEQGIALLQNLQRHLIKNNDKPEYGLYTYDTINDKLVSALLMRNRGTEAEASITELLEWVISMQTNASYHYKAQLLEKLVLVYGQAGRHNDVMVLLREAPWWGKDDVGKLSPSVYGMSAVKTGQFEVYVAQALEQSGLRDEAVDLLKRTLIKHPSADLAYDALTSMTGAAIVPWLDELASRDRFEERPLLWKAVILQREGDLVKAEEAARAAIKVDPTDGEQPKGARLKAYAVLADILAEGKQTTESNNLKQVVAAVRLAERGDELNEIGLAEQAVETYLQASRNFSDAYCVEWRLARRLQERGDEEGATAHYEKAFQLMPNQFGQLANLCFGCENIFETEKPQSIAERVLQGMVASPPVKPTVYDLLGQLREAQGNHTEAADYYRKATQEDPDYYDAWKHLYDVSEKAFMDPRDRASIAEELIRLDPSLRHFNVDSDVEVSPRVLWEAGERNRRWKADTKEPVFELAASKALLEKTTKQQDNQHLEFRILRDSLQAWTGPAQHLVDQKWMSDLVQITQYGLY